MLSDTYVFLVTILLVESVNTLTINRVHIFYRVHELKYMFQLQHVFLENKVPDQSKEVGFR